MTNNNQIAGAILLGTLLVAGAIVFNGGLGISSNVTAAVSAAITSPARDVATRAIYGDEDAEITVVEFSDFQCPYCAQLHPTLKRVVDESEGRINWEYRHLPIPGHRSAERASVLAECVLAEKGTDAFWKYTTEIFENQQKVSNAYLATVAESYGISKKQQTQCISDISIQNTIARDVATARYYGGSGTPFNVVMFADGSTKGVSGALPYEQWIHLLQ